MTNICAIDSMVSPQLARISRGQSNTLLICVSRYNLITQTWVNDVPFIVGHDGDFGQSKAMGLLSNPRHVAKGNPGQDLCVVPAKPIERQTIGGGMSTQDGVLIERIIEILSSPGKRDLYQFWTAISRIIPVMIERGRNYYVIGMHKESDLKSNSALYLSLGCLSKMSCAPVRIGGARKEIMATAQECRLETLQQLLSARDWRVRQATMQGLSMLAGKATNTGKHRIISTTLQKFLSSTNGTVRKFIAQGLVDLASIEDGTSERQIIQATLLSLMNDANWRIRQAAVQGLSNLADRTSIFEERQIIRAALLLLLSTRDWRVRQAAIEGLRNLAHLTEKPWRAARTEASERQFISVLLQPFLSDVNGNVRLAAFEGFGELAEEATVLTERQSIREILQQFLMDNDNDDDIRCVAAKGLGALAGKATEVLERQHIIKDLKRFLIDVNNDVQEAAAEGFGGLYEKSAKAAERCGLLEILLPLLSNTNSNARKAAALGFMACAEKAIEFDERRIIRKAIISLLLDSDENVRQVAVKGLKALATKATEASERQVIREVLKPFLSDEDWYTQRIAVEGLVALATKSTKASERQIIREILLSILSTANCVVTDAVEQGIRVLCEKATDPDECQHILKALEQFLKHVRGDVRKVAMHGFIAIAKKAPTPEKLKILSTTFMPFLSDAEKYVRKDAAQAFVSLVKATDVSERQIIYATLLSLLSVMDWRVRQAVVEGFGDLVKDKILTEKVADPDEHRIIREAIQPFLKDNAKNVRQAVVAGLTVLAEQTTDPDEHQIIREGIQLLVNDKGCDVRQEVVAGLTVLAGESTELDRHRIIREIIRPLLSDSDWKVRRAAVLAFEELDEKVALKEFHVINATLLPLLGRCDVSGSGISFLVSREFVAFTGKTVDSGERRVIRKTFQQLFHTRSADTKYIAVQGFLTLAKKAIEASERQFICVTLLPLLSDDDFRIRQAAVEGFVSLYEMVGNSDEHRDSKIDLLALLLSSADRNMHQAVVKALRTLARKATAEGQFIRRTLLLLLSNDDFHVKQTSVEGFVALYEMAVNEDERLASLEVLMPLLGDGDFRIRHAAVKVLQVLSKRATTASEQQFIRRTLLQLLSDGDFRIRHAAIEGFAPFYEKADNAGERRTSLETLAPLLSNDDFRIRQAAVEGFVALYEMADNADECGASLETLAPLLGNDDRNMSQAGVKVLQVLAGKATETLEQQFIREILSPLLSDGERIRTSVEGFVTLYEKADNAGERRASLESLAPLLDDDDKNIRQAGVKVLKLLAGTLGRAIIASDFLKELNHHLRHEEYPSSRTLPKSECLPEHLIRVISHEGNGKARIRTVYDPEHILMTGEIFTPRDHNHLSGEGIRNGTRKVGFYSWNGTRVLCIKEEPEAPGMEIAALRLYETLFGVEDIGMPKSEVIVMGGKVFTVSSYVDGKGFDEVMQSVEAQAEKQSHQPALIVNLHQMKVFAMLTEPEDGRAQNYIWQEIIGIEGRITYRFVSIDNERSLGNGTPHLSCKDLAITVRGHSIVHCFHENNPDYANLLKVLYSQTPEAILTKWLNQVRIEYSYHRNIARYARITEKARLGVPITEDTARTLYEKLIKIRKGLREKRTLEDTFRAVDPSLAAIYQTLPLDGDHLTSPGISLVETVKTIRRVDGGRVSRKAPPSAYCEIHGDYLQAEEVEPVMASREEPIGIITRWWENNAHEYSDGYASEKDY